MGAVGGPARGRATRPRGDAAPAIDYAVPMSTLRQLGSAFAATLRFIPLALALGTPAFAAAPPAPLAPAAVAPAAAPAAPAPAVPALVCPSGQACGDRCIAWTEVCSHGLADSLGYAPPVAVPAPAPGDAPGGSSSIVLPPRPVSDASAGAQMMALPRLNGAVPPGVREGAPPWCSSGNAEMARQTECLAWYRLGQGESAKLPASARTDCPQHLKCAGVCMDEGQVCPSVEPNSSKRLVPFEDPTSGGDH